MLQADLWALLEPLGPQEVERPPLDQEIADELKAECRSYFSGMIYGWKFTYRPSDNARQVKELLEVDPLTQIPRDDPRMVATKVRLVESEGRVYVDFIYRLRDSEREKRKAWALTDSDQSGGRGTQRIIQRQTSRELAFDQALKDAVRNLLRPRFYNKPAEIRGEAVLRAVPRFTVLAGEFVCTATFQIRQLSVRPYSAY